MRRIWIRCFYNCCVTANQATDVQAWCGDRRELYRINVKHFLKRLLYKSLIPFWETSLSLQAGLTESNAHSELWRASNKQHGETFGSEGCRGKPWHPASIITYVHKSKPSFHLMKGMNTQNTRPVLSCVSLSGFFPWHFLQQLKGFFDVQFASLRIFFDKQTYTLDKYLIRVPLCFKAQNPKQRAPCLALEHIK